MQITQKELKIYLEEPKMIIFTVFFQHYCHNDKIIVIFFVHQESLIIKYFYLFFTLI